MTGRRARISGRLESFRQDPRTAVFILAAASVASLAAVLWFGRGTTFSGDEAVWVGSTPGIDLHTLLDPHGGHLLALTRLVYWPLLEIFGLAYLPFRLLAFGAVLLTVWLLFLWGRRRTDDLVALGPCLVLLFFGSDYLHLLQGNGFTVMLSVALGIAALLSLEHGTKRGDLLACLWLTIGVFAYTVILPFVAGAGVMILLRRRGRRRLWVAAVPLAVYGLWRIWLVLADVRSEGGSIEPSNVLLIPAWTFQSLSAIINALTGLSYDFSGANQSTPIDLAGPPLALAFLALAGWLVVRRGLRTGLLAASVVALALFAIQCLAPGSSDLRGVGDARYMYPGAVAFLLVAYELARGWRPGAFGLVVLALVTLAGVGTNLALMRDNSEYLREQGREYRAAVGATQLMLEGASAAGTPYVPEQRDIGSSPTRVVLAMAAQDIGEFGYGPEQLRQRPAEGREALDRLLVGFGTVELVPAPVESVPAGCRRLSAEPDGVVRFQAPPGDLLLRSQRGGDLMAGRFADAAGAPVGELSPARFSRLRLPADSAPDPWQIAFEGPRLKVCG